MARGALPCLGPRADTPGGGTGAFPPQRGILGGVLAPDCWEARRDAPSPLLGGGAALWGRCRRDGAAGLRCSRRVTCCRGPCCQIGALMSSAELLGCFFCLFCFAWGLSVAPLQNSLNRGNGI